MTPADELREVQVNEICSDNRNILLLKIIKELEDDPDKRKYTKKVDAHNRSVESYKLKLKSLSWWSWLWHRFVVGPPLLYYSFRPTETYTTLDDIYERTPFSLNEFQMMLSRLNRAGLIEIVRECVNDDPLGNCYYNKRVMMSQLGEQVLEEQRGV